MDAIQSIRKIILTSITDLPDTLYIRRKDDLLLLNYKPEVQYRNLWTPIELISRGLIISIHTGEVVARPFDKFFNWGENDRTTTAEIKHVFEKMDGSLGIQYRSKGKMLVATRGSFDSEQAVWATENLNSYYNIKQLPTKWTLLFEIIYPDNRVVIDYKGWAGIVLLAIRNRFTGKYLPYSIVKEIAYKHDFRLPEYYEFSSPQKIVQITKTLPSNNEGWVVEFEDNQRFKFKGNEYIKLHRLLRGLTFKWALEHHQAGTLKQAKDTIPDEFHNELNGWTEQIDDIINTVKEETESVYKKAPKTTRKEFALWIQRNSPTLVPYLFARLDHRDLLPFIYRFAFRGIKQDEL